MKSRLTSITGTELMVPVMTYLTPLNAKPSMYYVRTSPLSLQATSYRRCVPSLMAAKACE